MEYATHFLNVCLIQDEHEILWIASKCLDLRWFEQIPGEHDDEGYEDSEEPLEQIWIWMVNAGVRDVSDEDVLYNNETILLAKAMQKDISDHYLGCADPTTTC